MTSKEFKKYLARDGWCLHCGSDDDTLVPQHRANRGHGGSKKADRASNIIVFCSLANSLIESDADWQMAAVRYGWKISRYQKASDVPVFDVMRQEWFLLDDNFGRVGVDRP